jgi:hypothetical protein
MVCTRHPAGIPPQKPGSSDKDILQGIIEHVAHVQYPCDVGRRDDYCIRLPFIGDRSEIIMLQPVVIPVLFYISRLIFGRNLHTSVQFLLNNEKALKKTISACHCR